MAVGAGAAFVGDGAGAGWGVFAREGVDVGAGTGVDAGTGDGFPAGLTGAAGSGVAVGKGGVAVTGVALAAGGVAAAGMAVASGPLHDVVSPNQKTNARVTTGNHLTRKTRTVIPTLPQPRLLHSLDPKPYLFELFHGWINIK